MKRIIDIVRHPRAAVIVHDFFMVLIAWFAASWLIEGTFKTPISNDLTALTGLLIVLFECGLHFQYVFNHEFH